MRRRTTNEMIIAIGLLLVGSATVFAWLADGPMTDQQQPVAQELATDAPSEEAPQSGGRGGDRPRDQEFDWRDIGKRVYSEECESCHREGEQRRRTPPLIGHVPDLYARPGGHAHLIDFLLYGLEGRIEVRGATYEARHAAYADELSDAECAAVLNQMLVSWGNEDLLPAGVDLYRPQDVFRHRHYQFTPSEVWRWRQRIGEPSHEE